MTIENQKYKDSVFRMLYSDKARLLELYNAMNGTNYDNPDDLEITTLEGNTFLNMKNDVSFVLDFYLSLYEHQSSPCPNIPLRDLFYVASIYRKLVPIEHTYKTQALQIPTPKFVVFYNGVKQLEDVSVYKLSDLFRRGGGKLLESGQGNGQEFGQKAGQESGHETDQEFIHEKESPELELVVTVLNINEGHNSRLMESAKDLKGYSIFVAKVRKYIEEASIESAKLGKLSVNIADDEDLNKLIIRQSVTKAIDDCIIENVLKDFFSKYREEVIDMSVLEYSAEKHLQVIKDEGYELGRADGFSDGKSEGLAEGRAEGRADGLAEGRAVGAMDTLCALVRDDLLDVGEAAKRAGMSVKEFEAVLGKEHT